MMMVRKGMKMMNRGDSFILNGPLSKLLVDVAWGEIVFVAGDYLSEVEAAIYYLGDDNWKYKILIFHS